MNWVFFQVSVAILLDNFLAASNALKMEKELRVIQRKQTRKQLKNPLDPLLLRLSKDYTNEADLSKRLRELFKVGRGSTRGPQADGGAPPFWRASARLPDAGVASGQGVSGGGQGGLPVRTRMCVCVCGGGGRGGRSGCRGASRVRRGGGPAGIPPPP